MRNLKEKYLQRIQQLLDKANFIIRNQEKSNVDVLSRYHEWKSGCKSLLANVVGKEDDYYQDFVENTKLPTIRHPVEVGVGTLTALKEDIELGLLVKVQTWVLAEVFSDFLEMAEHLLESRHKDPAALLIGAVLENGLRKLAKKTITPLKPRDDISAVNMKLADKKIYNKLTQSQIQTWKKLRDNASHGEFDDYDDKEVKDFLVWTKGFLEKHLS